MSDKRYFIRRAEGPVDWAAVAPLQIDTFFLHSSDHYPQTEARVVCDDQQLTVRFDVCDRYVRSVAQNYQDPVCKDSCVEFFVRPGSADYYFNFEVSAGGCMLLYRIPISADGKAQMDERISVPAELVNGVNIQHSLPSRVDPEIEESCDWSIEYNIPLSLFDHYQPLPRPLVGQIWCANFYKCADETSHPHWAMWSPILDGRRFHRPEYFGELVFE